MPTISNATVATGTGLSTAGNGGRKLVRLSNGWLVASVLNSGVSDIFYKSEDNGNTWTQLCFFNHGMTINMSSLAVKGTNIYFIRPTSSAVISFVKFDATTASNTNQTASALDSGLSGTNGGTSLAINDAGTELHAAWSSKNATYPNSFNIRYAKGVINGDGSVTWGAVQQVTTGNSVGVDYIGPSIVSMNGSPNIYFQETNTPGGGYGIGQSRWSGAVFVYSRVYYVGYAQSNPSALFIPTAINGLANGRLWVAWHGKDATDSAKFNVRVSYSDDGGVTWATPTKLTTGNLYDRQNVSLSADKTGKVFALYEEHQWSPDLDIYMRTYNGSWGAPVAVAEADPAAESNPSALVDYSLIMTTPPFVFTNATDGIKFSGNFNVGASVSPTSGALGNKETATLTAYTVTPEAGSTVTSIVEKVNGVTVNTYNNPASLSRTLTVPTATWDTLAYFAALTASITVTDSNGATTVTTYSFDKRLATGASLLEATKANTDAKNRMRSQLDAISTRVGVANGSSTNQIISAIDARNVVKRQNGTAVVSGGQIVVNTLGFLPKTITIRSSATQNGTYSELLGTNESRNGTTITQNAFTNISATGFTALISGTNVTWEAQG